MALTKERSGEIALAWLRHHVLNKGVKIHPNLHREFWSEMDELKKFAPELKLTDGEATRMAEELVMEVVDTFLANLVRPKKDGVVITRV